jgi:hypothetical protein
VKRSRLDVGARSRERGSTFAKPRRPAARPSTPAVTPPASACCWLAAHGVPTTARALPPCDGRLVRCHLIPQGFLRREFAHLRLDVQALVADPRSWVWGCGGIAGNAGHHGMLDVARTLRIPRDALPPGLESFAVELGIAWFLDRAYPMVNEREF